MHSEHDANLSLVPLKQESWQEPSRCHRSRRVDGPSIILGVAVVAVLASLAAVALAFLAAVP